MRRKLACLLLLGGSAFSQSRCELTAPVITPKGATIFSPEQEGYLGEIIADQMRQEQKLYPQPDLTVPIRAMADRLLRYMPANQYQFQFSLIEIPEANAFALPGGRIFVSRRLVAFVQNEDELAGVLAHEMGHVFARQGSVNVTRLFKSVLKVNEVTDRDDIFRKFNELLDNASRSRGSAGREVDDEMVADRVSLEAAWRAGYDPQGLPRLLDRLAETKGATGNFLSDLFGLTRPESKRLREMLKGLETIPSACRQPRSDRDDQGFRAWQMKVADLRPEDLIPTNSNLVPAKTLLPKLRPEITNIRFSPDGHFLLAQDGSGINILQRDPFTFLFRIPALEGRSATFLKDSIRIAFEAAGSRVEIWNLETRSRERVWAPQENQHCLSLLPSPDGRFAACFWGLFGKNVRLIDLDSRTEVGNRTNELDLVALVLGLLEGPGYRPMHGEFSPDGGFFLLSSAHTEPCCEPWTFDLAKRKEISIGNPLKSTLGGSFAFVGADRIAAVHLRDVRASGVFSWPQGKQLDKFTIPPFPLASVTKGPAVLLRPFQEYAVAALDTNDKFLFQVSSNAAMDRYEDVGAAERATGEIALYPGRETKPLATLQLPDGELGRLRSAAHSPDLKWLALSLRSRATCWNLETGQALLSEGFDGGSISAEGVFSATFERREANTGKPGFHKLLSRDKIDLEHRAVLGQAKLPEEREDRHVQYAGIYEVAALSDQPSRGRYTFQVTDTLSNRVLWSRVLDDFPGWHVGEALVLEYSGRDKSVDRILKESPELKRRLESGPKRDEVSLLEVLALDTGKMLGRVLFDRGAGSVFPKSVHVAGGKLFVEDSSNRTLAYSLETGERSGQQFGRVLGVNASRNLAAVQNEPGSLTVYDASMQSLARFSFPGNIIYAGFDGPRQASSRSDRAARSLHSGLAVTRQGAGQSGAAIAFHASSSLPTLS